MVATQETRQVQARDEAAVSTMVFHLGRELRTALDRRFESHGITSQQAALLLLSRLLKEPSPIKMAARLGTDSAGMTRLLDRLERKQLIARRVSPDDRRVGGIEVGPRSRDVPARLLSQFPVGEKGPPCGFKESK